MNTPTSAKQADATALGQRPATTAAGDKFGAGAPAQGFPVSGFSVCRLDRATRSRRWAAGPREPAPMRRMEWFQVKRAPCGRSPFPDDTRSRQVGFSVRRFRSQQVSPTPH